MSDQRPWPKSLVDLLGRQVRRYRKEREWSVRQLSEELDKIGMPMEPPVITNLELGRRGTVSVAELLALGDVLRVAPLLLLFPLGRVERMEVLSGRETDPWAAFRWAVHGGRIDEDGGWVIVHSGPADLFQEHTDAVFAWDRATKALHDSESTEQDKQSAEQTRDASVSAIRSLRAQMRSHGLTPPRWLPVALRYLDEEGTENG